MSRKTLTSKLRWLRAIAKAYPEEASKLRHQIESIERTLRRHTASVKGGA